jgi:molybdopterin-containing oxidoreductase family membrane subunit
MATQTNRLPYGVGRFSPKWTLLVVVLAVLIGLGAFAYSLQLTQGEIVTGMRNIGTMGGATWGLYIAFYVYCGGVGFAGMTLAALIRLLGWDHLRPIARMAMLLTVVALILGAMGILVDVGQPVRALTNLFRYARPQSPFFGTFTLVLAGYLFGTLVYLFLDGRRDAAILAQQPGRLQKFHRLWASGYKDTPEEQTRHNRASFWLALAILPLLVVATSTLGLVFGLQVGRPGWFSALQAPGFVILAGASGLGLLILIAAILRRVLGEESQVTLDIFKSLANFLMLLIGIYLYFTVVEWLSSIYTGHHHEVRLANALIRGPYAPLFWLTVTFLVISLALLIIQYVRQRYTLPLIVLSGALVNLAALGKRYLIVVPSQTHGTLLPYTPGSYAPTLVEYAVVLALLAIGTLIFAVFVKVFPILEISEQVGGGE